MITPPHLPHLHADELQGSGIGSYVFPTDYGSNIVDTPKFEPSPSRASRLSEIDLLLREETTQRLLLVDAARTGALRSFRKMIEGLDAVDVMPEHCVRQHQQLDVEEHNGRYLLDRVERQVRSDLYYMYERQLKQVLKRVTVMVAERADRVKSVLAPEREARAQLTLLKISGEVLASRAGIASEEVDIRERMENVLWPIGVRIASLPCEEHSERCRMVEHEHAREQHTVLSVAHYGVRRRQLEWEWFRTLAGHVAEYLFALQSTEEAHHWSLLQVTRLQEQSLVQFQHDVEAREANEWQRLHTTMLLDTGRCRLAEVEPSQRDALALHEQLMWLEVEGRYAIAWETMAAWRSITCDREVDCARVELSMITAMECNWRRDVERLEALHLHELTSRHKVLVEWDADHATVSRCANDALQAVQRGVVARNEDRCRTVLDNMNRLAMREMTARYKDVVDGMLALQSCKHQEQRDRLVALSCAASRSHANSLQRAHSWLLSVCEMERLEVCHRQYLATMEADVARAELIARSDIIAVALPSLARTFFTYQQRRVISQEALNRRSIALHERRCVAVVLEGRSLATLRSVMQHERTAWDKLDTRMRWLLRIQQCIEEETCVRLVEEESLSRQYMVACEWDGYRRYLQHIPRALQLLVAREDHQRQVCIVVEEPMSRAIVQCMLEEGNRRHHLCITALTTLCVTTREPCRRMILQHFMEPVRRLLLQECAARSVNVKFVECHERYDMLRRHVVLSLEPGRRFEIEHSAFTNIGTCMASIATQIKIAKHLDPIFEAERRMRRQIEVTERNQLSDTLRHVAPTAYPHIAACHIARRSSLINEWLTSPMKDHIGHNEPIHHPSPPKALMPPQQKVVGVFSPPNPRHNNLQYETLMVPTPPQLKALLPQSASVPQRRVQLHSYNAL